MSSPTSPARVTRRSFLRTSALIPLIALAVAQAPDSAAQVVSSPVPVLLQVSHVLPATGSAVVHGEGFSPGGSVYLSITSSMSSTLSDSFWTIASEAAFGPNGSQDPALGYVAAGTIEEQVSFDSAASYGPNGSQDPAQGFREARDSFCPGSVEIQAFDAESRSWSNRVRVEVTC